mmetsp:Transcript_1086/g.3694  ORF Transcript_1086/g.3694 Transcript_1086/m.3694 type:complete len:167 (+) Transcript_1086:572-1072(+)
MAKLLVLSQDRRLSVLNRRIESSKRLILLISENKIPRVHALVARQLRRGASTDGIIKQVQKAINGSYMATGNRDEDELDKARLVMLIAPRLLTMLHATDGFATKRSLQCQHSDEIPRFITSVCDVEESMVRRNFEAFVFKQLESSGKCLWHIAIDGVACEEASGRP